MSWERLAYTVLYIVQVGFQVSFQVDQDMGHVKSDLESPGLSYGAKIFWLVKSLLIISHLCKGWVVDWII